MSRARTLADYGNGIDTASITSGTFPTARIADDAITLDKLAHLGTDGQVLTSTGTGSAPAYEAVSVSAGSVIEQFMSPCDGSSITVQSGTYTVQDVTGEHQMGDAYSGITGSSIDYVPPTGTQTVIYKFDFQLSYVDDNGLFHMKLFIDNDAGTLTEVTQMRLTHYAKDAQPEDRITFAWPFHIGGSDDDSICRRDTWTSARTIQVQGREGSSGNEVKLHETSYWDGSSSSQFSVPIIGITALA